VATVMLARDFLSNLSELQPNDQARVIQFVTQFQGNPASPGISLERIRSPGGNLWSGRVSQDLRAILYKDGDSWAVLHADRHDAAYAWAERKQVGPHSVTGALQVVDMEEVERARSRLHAGKGRHRSPSPGIFDRHSDEYLLSLGVPEQWLPAVREIRNEPNLFEVCERLPEDVAERLLTLATGRLVTPPAVQHRAPVQRVPDTRRRFFVADSTEDLRLALEAPLESWIAFLHPSQRAIVDGKFNGPVKVTGSAGTGKTVVALHRARKLAREGKRVLLTSYVTTLCENLDRSLALIAKPDVRERITVSTVHSVALELVRQRDGDIQPAGSDSARAALDAVSIGKPFDQPFIHAEWENVIQRQGISAWADYRSARRVGRGTPLSVRNRKALWDIFGDARERLRERHQLTWADLCIRATELLSGGVESSFDAVVVDELQDLNAAEIRFLYTLATAHPGDFMVVGDAGQRIYPGGFSLRALGVEVRGRSHVLRINYRTTEQIRRAADAVLGKESDDMDAGTELRDGTRSLLSGPDPDFRGYTSWNEEKKAAAQQVDAWLASGLAPEDIALFARVNRLAESLERELAGKGIEVLRLSRESRLTERGVRAGTMHRAKGLEFKAVLVAGVGATYLPYPASLRGLDDPKDREDAVERERRLLYVSMTRARDELVVSWSGRPSGFLESVRSGL
jgi:UvrD/REP helicase N-terminal domain/UvrD-like helicase C-terminal domain